jgi:hypothetical protein
VAVAPRRHAGPVLSARFPSPSVAATGGTDRNLIVYRWDGQLRVVNKLTLTLRCAGIQIEGVKEDRERRILEELRARMGSSGPDDSKPGSFRRKI